MPQRRVPGFCRKRVRRWRRRLWRRTGRKSCACMEPCPAAASRRRRAGPSRPCRRRQSRLRSPGRTPGARTRSRAPRPPAATWMRWISGGRESARLNTPPCWNSILILQVRPNPRHNPLPMNTEQNHLLVVDDDPELRDLLRRYLEEHGFQVGCVADGAALEKYLEQQQQVDLVILDLMLPGVDGLSLARSLRSSGDLPPSMPAIMSCRRAIVSFISGRCEDGSGAWTKRFQYCSRACDKSDSAEMPAVPAIPP